MSGTPDRVDAAGPRRGDLRDRYDVVVVGGGPAGLAGALTTARALRSTDEPDHPGALLCARRVAVAA